ncbi:leucine-rich repeat and WD repeat-containing protein 1-like [Ornithodoros turicata]|uniref:leucine-rich repeat and WD repeat-containing protein 1-like n=1 Tax=Ornithodoros turicata TaxID=34597 RepID=UPI00313A0579
MITASNILSIIGHKAPSEIRKLDLSGRGIKCLDKGEFQGLENLTELDLSRNALKTVPDLNLPSLKKLNIEENLIQDVTFLKNYPSLTELLLTGNPILFADRNIAVSLLPKLKLIDGNDCQSLRILEANGDKKIIPQVARIWKSYFKDSLTSKMSEDDVRILKADFLRRLRQAFIECNEFPQKFRKFKVEALGEELFQEKVRRQASPGQTTPLKQQVKRQDQATRTSPRTPVRNRQTPSKEATPLKNYLSTKAGVRQVLFDGDLPSPRKRIALTNEISAATSQRSSPRKASSKGAVKGAEVIAFLRCHSADPDDSNSQVWHAAFEPDCLKPGKSTSTVATCGGSVINFIDCSTASVLKRYKHGNLKEEFFCVAWSTLIVEGRLTTILAAAGKAQEISLIHPEQLVCYNTFPAHTGYVNCLAFCRSQPAWLFSGGLDQKIFLWDIGCPVIPSYKTKIQKLLCLDPGSEVLQIQISTKHNHLLAACHSGLYGWNFDGVIKTSRSPNVEFKLPKKDGRTLDEPLVDGLIILPNDTVVSKCSGSQMIGTWSLSASLKSKDKHSYQRQKVLVKYDGIYEWSTTQVDYLYPAAAAGTLACGDDAGSIWIYNMAATTGSISQPVEVLKWPTTLECDGFSVRKKDNKININSVALSTDGGFLVACTDINIICIWKLHS